MLKDYAKSSTYTRSDPSPLPLALGALALTLALFSLILYKHLCAPSHKTLAPATHTRTQTNLVSPPQHAEAQFDFYTLLPQHTYHPEPTKNRLNPPYIVQADSFATRKKAEKLKKNLISAGLKAQIQVVHINTAESWYRVYIGPFQTKQEALQIQQDLPNLNSVILKICV